jgi:signal transduction histidine kinase
MPDIIKRIRNHYSQRTIISDLTNGLVFFVTFVLVLAGCVNFILTIRQMEVSLNAQAVQTSRRLAEILSFPIWTLDKPTIENIVEAYQQSENVKSIQVFDEFGRPLVGSKGNELDVILSRHDILHETYKVGTVEVAISRSTIRSTLITLFWSNVFAIVSVFVTLQIGTAVLMRRFLSRPMKGLIEGLDTIAEGQDYRGLAPLPQADLNEIIQRVNRMAQQIGDRVEALRESEDSLRAETAERKLIEQELIRYQEHLQELVADRTAELVAMNKELESFSYSISHDLRAPLRHIDGYSYMLAEDFGESIPPEALEYIQQIRNSIHRMSELIEGLLMLSHLNQQAVNLCTVEPRILVEQALEDLSAEQAGRQIEIRIGELPTCQADSVLLGEVFANLIENAIKYTCQRERAIIEIGSLCQDGKIVYTVRDNGVGFDMKYAHKLFGIFQRLHAGREFSGTGIGLALAQRIIQRHGGSIWAESEVNVGSTFYFTVSDGK